MKPKVIQVIPSFRTGGAESLVKNYLLNFNKDNCEHEAFVLGKRYNAPFENELIENGIKVTFLSELYKKSKLKGKIGHVINSIRWRKAVRNYFKKENPNIVHCHLHVMQMLLPALSELKSSKLFYTVHNEPDKYWAYTNNSKELMAVKKVLAKRDITFFALDANMIQKNKKYLGNEVRIEVLNNCVDTSVFKPNLDNRATYRNEIKVKDSTMVIGHVGRFSEQKNHKFIVDVFFEINKRCENAHLVFVGDGELRKETELKVKDLALENKVSFLGIRSDIPKLLSAFDVFLFPSLWEGLPLTLIEAQAAELPCFVSDSITKAIDCSNLMTYIPLDAGADKWAEAILSYKKEPVKYGGLYEYDIHSVLDCLLELYGVK